MKVPKVAIIHEWFINYAGSEKVVEQILNVYPEADLMALLEFLPEEKKKNIRYKKVKTSVLQYFPFSKPKYRYYLPLMPWAVGKMRAPEADIILSSSHAVAKGLKKTSSQLHICYCHTPVRYAWDLHDEYLRSTGLNKGFKSTLVKAILKYIRKWDLKSAENVTYFIANSHYVAQRIKNIYKREAEVIYPPVDTNYFTLQTQKADFYLTAARMVPYKKVDLIVEAFTKLPDKQLIVIGDGPDLSKIKAKAGSNVKFLGYQPGEMLKQYMQRAKAFVFAADEDFGITSIEVQACGTPVLAFKKGGNLETVVDHKTGLFFDRQEADSIKECVQRFEKIQATFDPSVIRKHAEKFSEERFRVEYKNFVERKYQEFLARTANA